jgi:hypothetical protein
MKFVHTFNGVTHLYTFEEGDFKASISTEDPLGMDEMHERASQALAAMIKARLEDNWEQIE